MPSNSLQTARLTLRSYSAADIPDLIRLAGAREVAATTLRIPHPYTEQDGRNFIEACAGKSGPETRFAITLTSDGQLYGGIGLGMDEPHKHAELGYWLGVPYWGQGFATEAARAMIRYGFETLSLHRIYASYIPENVASGRILQKIGMRREGYLRCHVCKWGEFHDLEFYGMLKTDARS